MSRDILKSLSQLVHALDQGQATMDKQHEEWLKLPSEILALGTQTVLVFVNHLTSPKRNDGELHKMLQDVLDHEHLTLLFTWALLKSGISLAHDHLVWEVRFLLCDLIHGLELLQTQVGEKRYLFQGEKPFHGFLLFLIID